MSIGNYWRFGGAWCLHIHGSWLGTEAASVIETLVIDYHLTRRHIREDFRLHQQRCPDMSVSIAQHPRSARASFTSWRKPELSLHSLQCVAANTVFHCALFVCLMSGRVWRWWDQISYPSETTGKITEVILRCSVVYVRSFTFGSGPIFKSFSWPGTKSWKMFIVTPPDQPKCLWKCELDCALQREISTLSVQCDCWFFPPRLTSVGV